ncbi:MAG: hypothetical protein HY348_13390 [Nitrospira defluvii]|nr:hypothetical protein [Nitrospira defluvii]
MKNCPVKHCNQFMDGDTLACRSHWAMVPKDVRDEFRRICRVAAGTPSHVAAVKKVEEFLTRRAC